MSKGAWILAAALALAGCANPAVLAPMEPSRESMAAPRRPLSDAEKDAVSAAVLRQLGEQPPRAFKWLPLVVRPNDGAVDYCALVGGDDVAGEYGVTDANAEQRDFLVRLSFDRGGKLAGVELVAVGRPRSDHVPTMVDSTCLQDGYDVLK